MDDLANEQQRKIDNITTKAKASKTKAIKLKIQMERAL